MNWLCLKSRRRTPLQPEGTEGGVVRHQNNTCPIMAGGCHVMTENVVIKGDNMKSRCPPTTSLCWGDAPNIISAHIPRLWPRSRRARADLTVSHRRHQRGPRTHETGWWRRNNQVARLLWQLEGSRAADAGSHIPRMRRRNSALRLSKSTKTPPFAVGCGCKRLPSSVRVRVPPVPPPAANSDTFPQPESGVNVGADRGALRATCDASTPRLETTQLSARLNFGGSCGCGTNPA